MNSKELAAKLNGRQYVDEITREEEKAAKDAGLVVVFGYSDDCVELRGAINDEIDAFGGTTIYVDKNGIIDSTCSEKCRYFQNARQLAKKIKATWNPGDGASWKIETDIPHEKFDTMDGEDVSCHGIVFHVGNL